MEKNEVIFGEAGFDWVFYDATRPTYPASFWNLILTHHATHNGNYTSALDLGAGSGVAALTLARHFSSVVASDVSAYNLEQCRTKWAAVQGHLAKPCTLSFVVGSADTTLVEAGSMDMVVIFTALHFTEVEQTMHEMWRALRPGGTAVVACYGRLSVTDCAEADEVLQEIWREVFRLILSDQALPEKFRRVFHRVESGLDYVPLSGELWEEGGKRFYVNTRGAGWRGLSNAGGAVGHAESRVDYERESVQEVEDVPGWSKRVGSGWFDEYLESVQLMKGTMEKHQSVFGPLIKRFKELIDAAEGGNVTVTWAAGLVLATKKR